MPLDLNIWQKPGPILADENEILKKYILEPKISIHNPKPHFYPRTARVEKIYHLPACPASTTLVPERDPQTGQIIDFHEISIQDAGSNSKNSMSLLRAPGPPQETTRGSAMNFPFWPGGFDELKDDIENLDFDNYDFEHNLLSVAPGFSSGIEFAGLKADEGDELGRFKVGQTVDLLAVIADDGFPQWDEEDDHPSNETSSAKPRVNDPDIDEPLFRINNEGGSILQIAELETKKENKAEYAEIIDITRPLRDFNKQVPDPAHTFPFELDTFQKHAILKLEEHSHVFVAAHTSAGKTVVAEYAIALSRKHMTRVIYTSPIKALSNQKYRDFRQTFGDVGLITGDIQIDSTASCLIMTTEILKSMLYCGSDVTRDLEYVIFDEVHYITDVDRGHVWEEVLILLPDHVCIVMLSATVPNTLEFANWVGCTKKRKVYVISTLKRPVPLTHYLYTGIGGKSKDDIFLLVDENGQLQSKGYTKAIESREKRKDDNRGRMNVKMEQNMWIGLIDHLRRNEHLPVIAFILSRNRCDSNAENLSSVDLCTNREKYVVHSFFKRCIQKLKPPDRALPQVLFMEHCLKRGIGIHHSGILPILKEIVEMLFQHGLVKLLFATETFAMGVNMPARTVIFDSIQKYDRAGWRNLRPAEYTQMAGRAGRRGKDKTGTVIIVCKKDVPDKTELQNMILGKPMRLESQFRLTYSMILNLLRVERVTVEDMMSHSFKEYGQQLKVPENKEKLRQYEEKFSTLQALSDHLQPLCEYYDVCFDYIQEWNQVMPTLFKQPKVDKELKPGKILIITHKHHYNKLGIILSVATQSHKESLYKVLVLEDQQTSEDLSATSNNLLIETDSLFDRGELWHWMLSLSVHHHHFIPEGIGGHAVVSVKCNEIVFITKTSLKVETDKIIQNWDQRQIPRFRDSPPGQSVVKAVSDLNDLNNGVVNKKLKLEFFQFGSDFNILESYEYLQSLKQKLNAVTACTDISNFDKEFAAVFDRKQLEKKLNDLKFQLSHKNLTLYPDYCNKLEVLKELNYIDDMEQVAMKGRVACQMSQNELMITELVLQNILTDLEPAEIAALLSSLVFQAKSDCKPKLTETLKVRVAQFNDVEANITKIEQKFKVGTHDDTVAEKKLNFGLIEVVYEWARNKPFAEIMMLTDIKEGIIVRCIQQLHETLRAVKDAARIIGDPILHSKMEEASNVIKRDIVFAASLYTLKEDVVVVYEKAEQEDSSV